MNLTEALEKGYLHKERVDPLLIKKEIDESNYDFTKAEQALREKDYKWAIIKSYYSMFHSAKAVCFSLGYREKKHLALIIMLEELARQDKIEKDYLYYFKAVIDAREGADYHYIHSEEHAKQINSLASSFNLQMKKLLKLP